MEKKIHLLLFLMLLGIAMVNAQTKTITGMVTDGADGLPIPGASVIVKGTTNGTITTFDGQYSISVPQGAQVLSFSFVGMTTQEISIADQSVINVVLKAETTEVDEVVVTAYGSKGKVGLKGSISVVEAKDLEQVPVATFDQMLQGKTTGLQINSGSGQPGSGNTKVRIRGSGSIMASNEPLYVVDGVPIEGGAFASLNANDFETVSVLKDASATSIYGSRASNGVILITTKKGKEGKTKVNFRHQSGLSFKSREKFNMMNSEEKLWFEEIVQKGPGWELSSSNPVYSTLSPEAQVANDAELARLKSVNTDWQDIVFRTGKTMSNEVNFSGGNQKTTFYAAYQNYMQEGLTDRSDLNRHAFRLNLNHKVSEKIRIGINSSLGQSKINRIESEGGTALMNPFAAVYLANPYEEPYDADGNIVRGNYRYVNPYLSDDENALYYAAYSKTGANMLDQMKNSTNKSNEIKFVGAVNMTWDITADLTAKTQYGVDYRQVQGERWVSPEAGMSLDAGESDATRQGSITESFAYRNTGTWTNTLDYKKMLGDRHMVGAIIGSEYIHVGNFSMGYTGYGLDAKLPETPSSITGGTAGGENTISNNFIPVVSGGKSEKALFSIFSMLNYTFDGKYTLSGSLRRDGSSSFGENKKYVTLYSAGFTWALSQEEFIRNIDWIDNLKFRASYGTTGNQEGIGNYASYTLWGTTSYMNNAGYALTQAGNPDLQWEVGQKFNVGIDYHLFKNRLNGSLDFYNDITSELFISQTYSAWAGVPGSAMTTNAGKMRNRGVEFLVNYDIISKKNLRWTVGTNISYNQNEILDLGQVSEFEQGTSIIREGLPLGSHYMVEWAGVNPANGNAMYYTEDGQLTETYSADDAVAKFGTDEAPLMGGFHSSVSYKGLELSAQLSYSYGAKRLNNQKYFQENPNFSQFNLSTDMLNIWRAPGDITDIQGAHSQREFTSKDVEDASYLRLRNVTFAYNLPTNILKRSGFVEGCRLYVQGQNLLTFTNWSGFDPEDSNNIASYEYPTPRVVSFGIDLSF